MVQFQFTFDPSITLEQRVGFELAASIWGTYLTDDITVRLHIGASQGLGENGSAVGGAAPVFVEQNYGVFQQYAAADATTSAEGEPETVDEQAIASLQTGNTADFVVNGEVIDGNSDILLTSAQAKAFGMDSAITLENGTTWDQNLVDSNAIDGYIVISDQYNYSYDYKRNGKAPKDTLDFLSVAMHEIGHTLGFFSSLDGSLDITTLHSGETQVEDFSVLDLYRHSLNASEVDNPDGAVSDLTVGENAYFSIDGGDTNLADFATGVAGDGYQASHWKRMKKALGVMDPTLAYRERLKINGLDLQAMDVLGWDVDYEALEQGLDFKQLLSQAEAKAAKDLDIDAAILTDSRGSGEHGDRYGISYGQWWGILETQLLALGYGKLFQVFELGYGKLFQEHEEQFDADLQDSLFQLGYGKLFQIFEDTIFELGYGKLFQEFEADMLELGYGKLFQLFEIGYGKLFQTIEPLFGTQDYAESAENIIDAPTAIDFSGIPLFSGGADDDIIGGSEAQDRVDGGLGDDLIDGKDGEDLLDGGAGRDIIYGGSGDDIVYGGNDDDRLLGEDGNDQLFGERGHDIMAGGYGHDILSGGTGRDDLKGASGNDVLAGGKGDDVLSGEANNDLLMGNQGADILLGGAGDDILYGDKRLASNQAQLNILRKRLVKSAAENADVATTESFTDETEVKGFIRIEAESMSLSNGYYVDDIGVASGKRTIANRSFGQPSTARKNFNGVTGRYMVVVHYVDESDGQATATVKIGDSAVDSWQFSQNNNQLVSRTIATDITIQNGEVIEILGSRDGDEMARIDYIDFIPLETLLTTPVEQSDATSLLINSSFESGLVGWMDGTDLSTVQDAATGSHVLQLGSAGSGTGQNIAIAGEGIYTFSTLAKATGDGWSGFGITIMDENWNDLEKRTYQASSDTWQAYSDAIFVTDEARYINVWANKSRDSGVFLLDDWSLTAGITQVSAPIESLEPVPIIQNGDFEADLGESNWQIWSGTGDRSTLDAYDGTSLTLSGGNLSGGQVFDVTAGEVYELSFLGKSTSTLGWDGVGIDFYNLNGETIGSNSYQVTTDAWSEYTQKIIAPEGAVEGGIWFSKNRASGDFSIDNVTVNVVENQAMATIGSTVSEEGLLAHFSLDEGAGEALDNTVGGQSLATRNLDDSSRTTGKTGGGLRFDHDSQVARITAASQLQSQENGEATDGDFSLALWIRPEAGPTGSFRRVIGKGDRSREMGLWLDRSSNRLRFEVSTTSEQDREGYSQKALQLNQWNHVTYVKSGNQLSLYVNGQLDTSVTLQGQVLIPEGSIDVGRNLVGAVDDIYLYDQAIDITDIRSLAGYQADVLVGGLGDDQLFGDAGDDVLDGSDRIARGRGEQDLLTGGRDRDTFVLGDATGDYYLQNGDQDFATVTDFELGVDTIQLSGLSSYSYQQAGSDVQLLANGDLIAVFENAGSSDLIELNVIYAAT